MGPGASNNIYGPQGIINIESRTRIRDFVYSMTSKYILLYLDVILNDMKNERITVETSILGE